MNLHEYQAKQILQKYGINIPHYVVISSLDALEELLQNSGPESYVLKVQVHAGGRGLCGGVQLKSGRESIRKAAAELLGKKIVNQQTGPKGLISHRILITEAISFTQEFYLAMMIDRESAQSILLASPIGGVDIEKTAQEDPKRILKLPLSEEGVWRPYHLLRLIKFMGWEGKVAQDGIDIVQKLVKAFVDSDATLLEINPLVLSDKGSLVCLDAKCVIDDNAFFRQKELFEQFDTTQISPLEERARKSQLSYVALDGCIGCMVNGAGLAMATMDLIHFFGGSPANFLDVGGNATEDSVKEGFKIILSDPHVTAILVNIFGGIIDCEIIAFGIISAAKECHIGVPLIVRLEGTNADKGRSLLNDSKLGIISVSDLKEAAKEAVKRGQVDGHIS